MLTISAMEELCATKGVTLVMHPAIRKAVQRYQENFYVGACSFLRGEANGLFFLPLTTGSYVSLRFSTRVSAKGHPILRLDPVAADGLALIKTALADGLL